MGENILKIGQKSQARVTHKGGQLIDGVSLLMREEWQVCTTIMPW